MKGWKRYSKPLALLSLLSPSLAHGIDNVYWGTSVGQWDLDVAGEEASGPGLEAVAGIVFPSYPDVPIVRCELRGMWGITSESPELDVLGAGACGLTLINEPRFHFDLPVVGFNKHRLDHGAGDEEAWDALIEAEAGVQLGDAPWIVTGTLTHYSPLQDWDFFAARLGVRYHFW